MVWSYSPTHHRKKAPFIQTTSHQKKTYIFQIKTEAASQSHGHIRPRKRTRLLIVVFPMGWCVGSVQFPPAPCKKTNIIYASALRKKSHIFHRRSKQRLLAIPRPFPHAPTHPLVDCCIFDGMVRWLGPIRSPPITKNALFIYASADQKKSLIYVKTEAAARSPGRFRTRQRYCLWTMVHLRQATGWIGQIHPDGGGLGLAPTII